MGSRGRLRLRLRSRKSEIMFHEKNRLVFVLETHKLKTQAGQMIAKEKWATITKMNMKTTSNTNTTTTRPYIPPTPRFSFLMSPMGSILFSSSGFILSRVIVHRHLSSVSEPTFCVTLVTKDLIKCRSTLINLSLGVLSSALLLWHSCKLACHPHLWTATAAAKTKPYVSFSAFYRRYRHGFWIYYQFILVAENA